MSMENEFRDRFSRSTAEFLRLVVPRLEKYLGRSFGTGQLISVENSDERVAKILDCRAGIDALWVTNSEVIAITQHCQPVKRGGFKTFTLRRTNDNGVLGEFYKCQTKYGVVPRYLVQAYTEKENGVLLWIGIASIPALLKHCAEGDEITARDGQTFFAIRLGQLHGCEYRVIYQGD